MPAFRVIPIILYNGEQAVKTVKFQNPRNIGSVINLARLYENRNVDEIIFLDIFAAQPNFKIITEFARQLSIPFAVGGGIRGLEDAETCLELGADRIVIGSSLQVERCAEISRGLGNQAVIAAIDYHDGEDLFSRLFDLGPYCGEFMLTCIDREGTMTDLDGNWCERSCYFERSIILHGGFSHPAKAWQAGGADAIGIGSMFQFTQYTPNDVKRALRELNFEVRL